MDTKTYIKSLVKECVEAKKEETLKESIKPIVTEMLKESFMEANDGESTGSGKINVKALVKKLMKNPKFKSAAKSYLSKHDDYDGQSNKSNHETYSSLDNMSDGAKRRIVAQRLSDKKMNWAPMAYRLWPDMSEDAARSWFSKKVAGKGGERFTDEEVSTLFSLLNNKIS